MRIKSLIILLISAVLIAPAIAAEKKLALSNELDKNVAEETIQNVCATCHAIDGNSVIALNPKLAGQHSEYLVKQMRNFKDGSRANAVMAQQVVNLSPEEMQAIAGFYGSKAPTLAKAKTNGVGSLGEKIYRGGIGATKVPACAACHGANGEGLPKRFPRLSGQHAAYTFQQMKIFRTGERANAKMMQAIAARMTEAEMQDVADYIQGLR